MNCAGDHYKLIQLHKIRIIKTVFSSRRCMKEFVLYNVGIGLRVYLNLIFK